MGFTRITIRRGLFLIFCFNIFIHDVLIRQKVTTALYAVDIAKISLDRPITRSVSAHLKLCENASEVVELLEILYQQKES